MLFKSLIIIGVLLSFVCFIWLFVFDKCLPKMATLFLDTVLIIFSIGMFSAGFFSRNSYLKEGRENGTGQEVEQEFPTKEAAEPSYSPLGFTVPQTGREEKIKDTSDILRPNTNAEEKPKIENENVSNGIGQEAGAVTGNNRPETEQQQGTEAETPTAAAQPTGGEPQPGTETSAGAEAPTGTAAPIEQVPSASAEIPPPAVSPAEGTPENEITQEEGSVLNNGQIDAAPPDQGEAQAPNPEETGQ